METLAQMLLTDDQIDVMADDRPNEHRVLPSTASKSKADRVTINELVVGLFALSMLLDTIAVA